MNGLFDNDPAFKDGVVKKKRKLVRNSAGQFCTEEDLRVERIQRDNVILKRKVELFYRNWIAVGQRAARLDRENHELRDEIKELKTKIKKYEKRPKRKTAKA